MPEYQDHKWLRVLFYKFRKTALMEYTSEDEVASCNLASISLPKFVAEKDTGEKFFNHKELCEVAKKVVRNLDTIIDRNYYPVQEAKNTSLHNRAVGLGVQGLADVFILMRLSYTSEESKKLNRYIFETLYYVALEPYMEMAKATAPYKNYPISPIALGEFQFNLWGIQDEDLSGNWDCKKRRENIVKYGVKNSLWVALMPTVSTSLILENNRSFEPIHQRPRFGKIDFSTFLCMETWIKNRNVLPKHTISSRRNLFFSNFRKGKRSRRRFNQLRRIQNNGRFVKEY